MPINPRLRLRDMITMALPNLKERYGRNVTHREHGYQHYITVNGVEIRIDPRARNSGEIGLQVREALNAI